MTHRPTEETTARATLVLHHASPMVLTQNQQLHRVGGPHHLVFQHGALTPGQLSRTMGKEDTMDKEIVSVSQHALTRTITG